MFYMYKNMSFCEGLLQISNQQTNDWTGIYGPVFVCDLKELK